VRCREATDEKPLMKKDVNRNEIQEVLADLEIRLERYLVGWRRRLDVRHGPGVGIDREERRPLATKREEKRANSTFQCDRPPSHDADMRSH
jgi:hypothetical protein